MVETCHESLVDTRLTVIASLHVFCVMNLQFLLVEDLSF